MFHVKRAERNPMNQIEFITECKKLFELNRLPCTDQQAELLFRLTRRMLEVNQTMNLTAITDEKTVILRHYVDSLTISKRIPEGASVIDVGCGAGFPSLPLAIFRPDLQITSLDGTVKRIAYVAETAELLGLSSVRAIAGRAEEYAHRPDFRESFDVATARAVASLPVLCELCLPFVKPNGRMIAMKSQQAEEELVLSGRCVELCGGDCPQTFAEDLTANGVDWERRNLILIKKVAKTPKIYPRHFSKISKKPL